MCVWLRGPLLCEVDVECAAIFRDAIHWPLILAWIRYLETILFCPKC
jgi:hypothetical protein